MNTSLPYTLPFGVVALAAITFYGIALEEPSPSPQPSVVAMPLGMLEDVLAKPRSAEYIEVTDGCGPHYEGTCVNMRSGPGVQFPVVMPLRTGIVQKVASTKVAQDGRTGYKIRFDDYIRYPERVVGDWYVAADYVQWFESENLRETTDEPNLASAKRIIIDRTKQMLYAYEGGELFMQQPISTGLEFTPTPRGQFWIYRKMPDSYMQGPLPEISDQYYDLPGVPWDLYFTYQGGAIHGAYWHDNFGQPWSHGCVNLPPEQAKKLYLWADLGTPVTVRD